MMEESIDGLVDLMVLFRHKLIQPFEQSHRSSLSRLQYNTLRSLREKGPLSVSELATEVSISKQQMTPIVNKLLEKNLIYRTMSETDHRSALISISDAGQTLLANIRAHIIQTMREKLQPADDEELETLHTSLNNLNKLLDGLF